MEDEKVYSFILYILRFVVQVISLGAVLLIFGLFAVYSVSVFESFGLTLDWVDAGIRDTPSNYFFFFEQLINIGVGLGAGLIIALIPWRFIKKIHLLIFIVTFAAVLLLFTPIAQTYKGATAWLDLGFTNIQPGEFFKLGFVFFLGSWLIRKKRVMDESMRYIAFLVITGLSYIVFLLIPDLGTIYVLAPVSLIMFWYAGGKRNQILLTLVMGVGAIFLAATQFNHIRVRLDYYLHPEKYEQSRDIGRQNKQALLAIGGGGWIGKGYGKGLQKFGYLPEAQSDFIFAAVAEEIGVVGIGIILALYLALAWYVLKQLPSVQNDEDRIYAVGFLSLIMMQAFINIGVNMSLIPLTGLTLPFFSHGGSALLVNIVEIVLLRKITKK